MQFGVNIPNFDLYSDPHVVVELARQAEEAGWDGFFIWDHINYKMAGLQKALPMADPWIELAAIAVRTRRIKIGTMVTPLARRRPWKLARETATLDQLSSGRLIFGVGLGSDRHLEYSSFGEPIDPMLHAEMLDEALEVLVGLWSGETFTYQGKHYTISESRFLPRPVQQPRIPIWVAGFWPTRKPFQRASRWDGVFPLIRGRSMVPQDFQEMLRCIRHYRTDNSPFDIIASGQTSGTDKDRDMAQIAALAEVGVTWWQECFVWGQMLEQVRQRIQQGPPFGKVAGQI